MLQKHHRIAILMHDGLQNNQGKTGLALLRYSPAEIVAVIDRQSVGSSLNELTGIQRSVPIVGSLTAALPYRPDVLVLGIAPAGGRLPSDWWLEIQAALSAGLCLVNGLHTPLAGHPELTALLQDQQWIWDVRCEPDRVDINQGRAAKLPCDRVLTVGTDTAVGKMSTSLELHRACLAQGLKSGLMATGQTGLILGYPGVALDAVRVDFAAGAVEQQVLKLGSDLDILHIEGQGSLLNPASTATLPLLRGAQPTHLILVHRIDQNQIKNFPDLTIPPLPEVIQYYETVTAIAGAAPKVPVVAIALNTAKLDEITAQWAIQGIEAETGLPCTDPLRFGVEPLLQAIQGKP